jgi:hypothetical protein
VLRAVGKRLSADRSVADLTAIAARGDRVLAALTAPERQTLGRCGLIFQVDRPVEVFIAACPDSIPFWLADHGFRPTGSTLTVRGTAWPVYVKPFGAGTVGLGVNALDRSAAAHYAVFVRSARPDSVHLSGGDPRLYRTVAAREGTSTAFDAPLPIGRLPAELRGAVLVQTSHAQRHATVLARGRVWKTHVVSGPTPDQVAVAFGRDPARTLVWTWRTEPGVPATALRLAPAAPDGRGPAEGAAVRVVRGDSQLVESPNLLNDPVIRRHRATAAGLEPDTLYAYALGDGTPEGWTAWKTVRTGPLRPRRFQFLYMGDAQCGLEDWGKLLKAAHARHPGAGFLLLAGDLVDRGNERTNWDHFFLRAAGVLETLPLMPAAGNHEYLDQGPRLYSSFFALPDNGPAGIDPGLVYAFEYGNAFIAVLDSTLAVSNLRLARLQAEWLDAELARTRATWKLVMFHHPVYASHTTREYPALAEAWVPVFDRHRVDLVLQGHDHAYLRTYPMRGNRPAGSGGSGTIYVVSVSGTKFCEQDPRDYTEVGLTNLATYQTIDIAVPENVLVFRAWDGAGNEVDRFTLEKPASFAFTDEPGPR